MSRVAIVHPLTLIGKELNERLEAAPHLATEVRLYSADEAEVGTVTEAAGAAAFVLRLDEGALDDVDLVFFCGDATRDRQTLAALPPEVRAIVLSSGATRADGHPAAADLNEADWIRRKRLLSASPAALLLARIVAAVEPLKPRRAVATIVLPVSEAGQGGLDALFEETRALLTFTGAKKSKMFASQVAFNLIPGRPDGTEIEGQLATLLGDGAPGVAVQTVQGGIFHALTASVLLELDGAPSLGDLRRELAKSPELSMFKHGERLGPVEAAGTDRVLVGDLREAGAGRFWLWLAMDNLTTGRALHAIRLASALLGVGPVA